MAITFETADGTITISGGSDPFPAYSISAGEKIETGDVPRYNLINNINKAFFGRNWDKNRSYTQDEKMDMISEISKYDANEFTTAIPKFGHLLEGTNLSNSIMNDLF